MSIEPNYRSIHFNPLSQQRQAHYLDRTYIRALHVVGCKKHQWWLLALPGNMTSMYSWWVELVKKRLDWHYHWEANAA